MILGAIILAGLLGGLLSMLVAGLLIAGLSQHWLQRLVGFAAGVLLGAATLHILPEAFESGIDSHAMFGTVLAGLLGFFALQRVALWRHTHPGDESHHGHAHSHGHHTHGLGQDTVISIMVGDGFHNFVDGILIAAAFLTDPMLGWTTAAGVIAHEIPQEAGDFVILRNAGMPMRRALLVNGAVSLTAVAGGVIGYFALSHAESLLPYILILAGTSFLYIAVADLIPLLRREADTSTTLWQTAAMLVGVLVIWLISSFLHSH